MLLIREDWMFSVCGSWYQPWGWHSWFLLLWVVPNAGDHLCCGRIKLGILYFSLSQLWFSKPGLKCLHYQHVLTFCFPASFRESTLTSWPPLSTPSMGRMAAGNSSARTLSTVSWSDLYSKLQTTVHTPCWPLNSSSAALALNLTSFVFLSFLFWTLNWCSVFIFSFVSVFLVKFFS